MSGAGSISRCLVGLDARLSARRMLGLGLALFGLARRMEGLVLPSVLPLLPFDAEQGDEVQSGAGRRVSRGLSRDGRRKRVFAGRTPKLCIGRAMKKTTSAVLARLRLRREESACTSQPRVVRQPRQRSCWRSQAELHLCALSR